MLSSPPSSEEFVVRKPLRLTLNLQRQLSGVVGPPHRRSSIRDLLAGLLIIPAIGLVVNGMKNQPLVRRIGGKIRFGEQMLRDRECGLPVLFAFTFAASSVQIVAVAKKTLRGDGGGRAINRFVIVVGL